MTASDASIRMVDDLVRAVGIIALSANPLSPDPKTLKLREGFTAGQHQSAVESCRHLMAEYNLFNYRALTAESPPPPFPAHECPSDPGGDILIPPIWTLIEAASRAKEVIKSVVAVDNSDTHLLCLVYRQNLWSAATQLETALANASALITPAR